MVSIGVDYYPEHWDRTLWRRDAEMMKKTGVRTVRMGEFAWSVLEPEEDRFDFEWLDEAVKIFAGAGIDIILGTPTNCPPRCLYEKYPETVMTDRSGSRIALGIRGHRCYSSPKLREKAANIITKLCERYKDEPRVIGWQIDNELEASTCCCDICKGRFRAHLQKKFTDIGELNDRWGMNVWSGSFSSFDTVEPPMGSCTPGWHNPSLTLEWQRFNKWLAADFSDFQADLIRSICKDTVITTNTWFCEYPPDFGELFEKLDIVSYDNYPPSALPQDKDELYSHSFHLDLMRGIKRKSFWIMEQLGGAMGCWFAPSSCPRPGMIKGYALQAVAHGADKVIFFRWRSAAKGAEMFWYGLLDQSNIPSRRFYEFQELTKEINALALPDSGEIKADTAVLYSSDAESALYLQKQSDGYHYYSMLKAFHDGVTALGKDCDIVSVDADLSAYKIIIAPALFICSEQIKQKLRELVKNGASLIITNRSFVKNMDNTCPMQALPSGMDDVTGCQVSEFEPLGYNSVQTELDGVTFAADKWADVLKLCGAETLAVYGDRWYKGESAVTVNRFGKGLCFYAGAVGKRNFCKALIRKVCDMSDVPYTDNVPQNVEITRRCYGERTLTFVFNNNESPVSFDFEGRTLNLEAFECKMI